MQHFFSKLTEFKFAPPDSAIMEFSGYGAAFNNEDAYTAM